MATYLELAKSLYPNMPDNLLNMFADEWAETGDSNVAIAKVRGTMNMKLYSLETKELMEQLSLMK